MGVHPVFKLMINRRNAQIGFKRIKCCLNISEMYVAFPKFNWIAARYKEIQELCSHADKI